MNSSDASPKTPLRPLRPVRSFVLRQGRLTLPQQRAFAELWSCFGVEWTPAAALDFTALFGNTQPVTVEIGFGNGESLATMAEREPERNWLGIEVHRPGVGHLLLEIERRQLNNVRIIRHDAIEILTQSIPPASLAAVQLFFPDPWPKRRHHKRRILNTAFIELLARVIQPGGVFHAATDWESYAIEMLDILENSAQFANTAGAGQFAPRPASRPFTRFEQRGDRLGHRVCDLMFQRQSFAQHLDSH